VFHLISEYTLQLIDLYFEFQRLVRAVKYEQLPGRYTKNEANIMSIP